MAVADPLNDADRYARLALHIGGVDDRLDAHDMRLDALENHDMALVDRQSFVRASAIALFAEPGLGLNAARAWELAERLWAAKPEDC